MTSASIEETKKLTIDELLVRAISQGNGASRNEIINRQFATKPMPKLADYILDELMKSKGIVGTVAQVDEGNLGNDLHEIELGDNPDMICVLARRFKRDGFSGQGMRDQHRAAAYIGLAADNPRVMDELPPSGTAFWKSAEFHYRLWKQERKG
jgi:hypothetical protein